MICKCLTWIDKDEKLYYRLLGKLEEKVKIGDFVFIVSKQIEKHSLSIAEVVKICDINNLDKGTDIKILSECEEIHIVSKEYFKNQSEKDLKNHYNDSIEELNSFFNTSLKEIENNMFFARANTLNGKRKEYLLSIFCSDTIDEFYKNSKRDKNRWFYEFNNFELDYVHMINLYLLKGTICHFVEMNRRIQNKDKIALRNKYLYELEIKVSSIERKGINRYKSNEAIGVDISSDGKSIILGRFTHFELYLNLFSFWNIIKSLLTVSFIPIIVALLNNEKKIIIYSLLGVIYFITLILSDEKLVDNIVAFMCQIKWYKEKQSNYYALFYFGVIASLFFIIFSFQVVYVPNVVDTVRNFVLYLTGDILLAIIALVGIIVMIEVLFFAIIAITSTVFYIKRAKKISATFSFCFKTLFWILSVYCIYNILGINKYMNNNWQRLENEVFIFIIGVVISFLKMIQNFSKFKEKLKSRYEKSDVE